VDDPVGDRVRPPLRVRQSLELDGVAVGRDEPQLQARRAGVDDEDIQ
jgi:hypothetical protein